MSDADVTWEVDNPASLALAIRTNAVRMIAPHGFGYLGQALSAAEQVAGIFAAARPGRDRIVCSPGHYIIAPFAAAAALGLIDEAELDNYGNDGALLEAIGTEKSPVVDYTCGSLGQGLSAGAGFAWSDRFAGSDARTYVMISDGELEEGQIWEAAIFAAHEKLSRLLVLLDANNSQVDGPIDEITTLEPIADKWTAFGWHVIELDGHDMDAVTAALAAASAETERPSILVCRTSTVHGLDCLPEDADGHFIKLPPELAAAAFRELAQKAVDLRA
jgi:transketolase